MRAGAARIIGPPGILKSSAAFFRRGTSGAGREELSAAELAGYHERAAQLAPPDLLNWLHRAPGHHGPPGHHGAPGHHRGLGPHPDVWQS